ncbi:hypothetical protein BP6252_02447 [Coleophoma cylindrospora]|uniref:Zn(2)-C6 fungal-type domain-containing protein n=1 Tax=Coleophoma cylindrospora TaxID=1849047 RepID=A0A3D8SET0_9HELO|nr:hypothetical protein BP6252_02447 [Coleophoma cylindrospora]
MRAHETDDVASAEVPSALGKRHHVDDDAHQGTARPIPATIKSCNECRQQKLRCDVVKEPFEACSRCKRLKITCKIDSDFKRVPKRNKHAEMEREIRDLRQQLARKTETPTSSSISPQQGPQEITFASPISNAQLSEQLLEDISISGEQIATLFELYFTYYHSLCPLLDPKISCDSYFSFSPLLAWTVVTIAARRYLQDPLLLARLTGPYKKLLWTTISEMPQRYHTCKALALLCTWPLPIVMDMKFRNKKEKLGGGLGLSETDPTFMYSGIMMQTALQTGLHRPMHAQDFIRQIRDISDAEINDRKLTWAICNIVTQSLSNVNGQPSVTFFDWSLRLGLTSDWNRLPLEIEHRLSIEKFSTKVIKTLYSNPDDIVGLIAESEQESALNMLTTDLEALDSLVPHLSALNKLALLGAHLHFHTFAFFIPLDSPSYIKRLSAAYDAATAFIQAVLDYDLHSNSLFYYCPINILRALVSASCALLKILNSSLAIHFDVPQGRALFNTAILAMRNISLRNNDFADRVAEAMARMWRAVGSGVPIEGVSNSGVDPLHLNVRSRMSVSHIYDCIWGWRRCINLQNTAQGDERPVTPAISSIQFLPEQNALPYPQTEFFPEQAALSSSIEDFDLFNSLDWHFDGAPSFTWP